MTVTATRLCFSQHICSQIYYYYYTTTSIFINRTSLKCTHILCQTTHYIPLFHAWIKNKLLSCGKHFLEPYPTFKFGDYHFL